jgi:hypothetical protein
MGARGSRRNRRRRRLVKAKMMTKKDVFGLARTISTVLKELETARRRGLLDADFAKVQRAEEKLNDALQAVNNLTSYMR